MQSMEEHELRSKGKKRVDRATSTSDSRRKVFQVKERRVRNKKDGVGCLERKNKKKRRGSEGERKMGREGHIALQSEIPIFPNKKI